MFNIFINFVWRLYRGIYIRGLHVSPMHLLKKIAKAMNLPILVDDLIAQRIAKSYGIETYWTTSVVLRAWKENIISKDRTRKIIEDLIESGLRIKPEVVLELMKKLS
jgi:predicted nucleic acid-binding protein